jgi:glutathione S-transferase
MIRTVARIGDIYLMNNIFMCLPQARRSSRNDGIRDLLTGQVIRGMTALEHYIGDDGFAVGGRLSLADCALVPALFLVENVFETFDVKSPLPDCPRSSAYWAAIKTNEHAARTLTELHRGLEERREMMRAAATG